MRQFGAVTLIATMLLVAGGSCLSGLCGPSPCSMPDCTNDGWIAAVSCCCGSSGTPAESFDPTVRVNAPNNSFAPLQNAIGERARPAGFDFETTRDEPHSPNAPLFILNTSLLI